MHLAIEFYRPGPITLIVSQFKLECVFVCLTANIIASKPCLFPGGGGGGGGGERCVVETIKVCFEAREHNYSTSA